MLYLLPNANQAAIEKLGSTRFGILMTPYKFSIWGIRNGYSWAADSGAFTNIFDPDIYLPWLKDLEPWRETNLFVAVPDKVGDAAETLRLYEQWYPSFTGWRVAFVAQDGQENLPLPEQYDWLFIGGTTQFKMSQSVLDLIQTAQRAGKKVHVGRVNSLVRVRHFMLAGVDSVDGTHWIYKPRERGIELDRWMRHITLWRNK